MIYFNESTIVDDYLKKQINSQKEPKASNKMLYHETYYG